MTRGSPNLLLSVIVHLILDMIMERPPQPQVAFDAALYTPGDIVTITVTDPACAGWDAVVGTDVLAPVLVLKDATGAVLASWSRIPALAGTTDQFQVRYRLPDDVALGILTAIYTDPRGLERTASATVRWWQKMPVGNV